MFISVLGPSISCGGIANPGESTVGPAETLASFAQAASVGIESEVFRKALVIKGFYGRIFGLGSGEK